MTTEELQANLDAALNQRGLSAVLLTLASLCEERKGAALDDADWVTHDSWRVAQTSLQSLAGLLAGRLAKTSSVSGWRLGDSL